MSAVPPRVLSVALALLLAAGCGGSSEVEALDSPAGPGSLAPRLDLGADGALRLLWIEAAGNEGVQALRASALEGGRWSAPREIARGAGWFVNWADVPALAALADGTLLATWLEAAGADTYAYHVRFALSADGGATWSEPRTLHDDRSPTEHGFVSLVPAQHGFLAAWLDGRALASEGGAMALYGRAVGRDGTLGREIPLDTRACECCPTAAVATEAGALVAFRDRSADEVRDVALVALEGGARGALRPLHADGWRIHGCPVNGPALARAGERVGAAWFTAAGERPSVRARLSGDGGRSFGPPLEVAGAAPEGRVDACFAADGRLWVSWLEPAGPERSRWCVRPLERDGSAGEVRVLAEVGAGRDAGVARLRPHGDALVFAWTDPGPPARVRTLRFR